VIFFDLVIDWTKRTGKESQQFGVALCSAQSLVKAYIPIYPVLLWQMR